MVDRITPATTDADRRYLLEAYALEDRWPVVCEPFRQWVVEDDFVAGRPDIATVGAIVTDDVAPWELYKLRLLNAGHAAIAHIASLAGIDRVDEALAVAEIGKFLEGFLREESAPTLAPIPGNPPELYIADVLERFANRGIRDDVARLCVDGTAKVGAFIMPILRDQLDAGGPVRRIAQVLAAWAHYLAVVPVDEQAADPAAERVRPLAGAAAKQPAAFLDERIGLPPELVDDPRLAQAFTSAYDAVSRLGSLGALRELQRREAHD
jgi:mannitol 2-dehydrogenase